jgi:hypothetical protein
MASTGSSREAMYEGTIPAIKPIVTETETPITMFTPVNCKVKGKFCESNTNR